MELIRKTHIDFLGKRSICFALSGILLALSLWSLFGGINRGIDFSGGTEIQVKFAQTQSIDELRGALTSLDLGDVSLQSIGQAEDNEFIIRVGSLQGERTASAQEQQADPSADTVPADSDPAADIDPAVPAADEVESVDAPDKTVPAQAEEAAAAAPGQSRGEQDRVYKAVLGALRDLTGVDADSNVVDLNIANIHEITSLLAGAEGGSAQAGPLARAIADYRRDHAGLFLSFADLDQVAGMTPQVKSYLEANATLGAFTIRRVEYVGPRVGAELAQKAYLAMAFALVGMLVYITVRFRTLGFALGGIFALVHDGILAMGIFNLWGGQFDLTIVAAVLTLLGYSINDTIVIFDRVRENMRSMRGSSAIEIFNTSINQTLSRTLLTSLTTLLVVSCLYVFGGETIHGFAFVLLFGIIVGTYSTIFIASPVVIAYNGWMEGRKPEARRPGAASSAPSQARRRNKPRSAGGR
jgi:preprotein translocase subunit SecF